jgi:hypothetical protein
MSAEIGKVPATAYPRMPYIICNRRYVFQKPMT